MACTLTHNSEAKAVMHYGRANAIEKLVEKFEGYPQEVKGKYLMPVTDVEMWKSCSRPGRRFSRQAPLPLENGSSQCSMERNEVSRRGETTASWPCRRPL